jgi:hypothetical protein
MTNCIDFNLHNLFSIRLEDPSPKAVRAVQKQVGVQPTVLDSEPDLTVRYVDQLKAPMHHIVMGSTGFVDDEFHLVTGQGRKSYRVQFPFDALGQRCTVMCETGINEIPLLTLIINMRMLAKGLMPIHASAFVFDEVGVVVNGWPHGGKTSTLFSFLSHGAKFVSDDWLFVDSNCNVYGLMQPIKLSDWQLDQLPDYQTKVGWKKQWTIQGLRWLDSVEQFVPEKARSNVTAAKVFHRGVQFLNKSQRHVTLSPEALFDTGLNSPTGRLDLMFLTLAHGSSAVTVNPIAAEDALERLVAALRYEWSTWEEYYIQYLYAFPHKRNFRLEVAWDKQRNLLRNILAGKQIFLVNHPYPVKLDEIYSAINDVLVQFKETKQMNDPIQIGG